MRNLFLLLSVSQPWLAEYNSRHTPYQHAAHMGQEILCKWLLDETLLHAPPKDWMEVPLQEITERYDGAETKPGKEILGSRVRLQKKKKRSSVLGRFFSPSESKNSESSSDDDWLEGTIVDFDVYKKQHRILYDKNGKKQWRRLDFKVNHSTQRLMEWIVEVAVARQQSSIPGGEAGKYDVPVAVAL